MEKIRAFFSKVFNKTKILVATTIAAVASTVTAVVAFAEESGTSSSADMETMMSDAGTQLTSQFSSLVSTLSPVILGILGSGLVIFGIFSLISLAKKIFKKVAG